MSHATEPLSAATSSKLLDLARACKAAVRVVSMYPPTHPAIQDALTRITSAGTAAVSDGPFQFTVTPDALLVGGSGLARPDIAASELAVMLHAHSVGEVTLMAALSPAAWHAFLLLISQPPAEVRDEGGISRAWDSAGGGPIVIRQIDYGEVLRERAAGDDSDWQTILQAYLEGEQTDIDDTMLTALYEIAMDPQRMATFVEGVVESSTETGWLSRKQAQLAKLIQALAAHVTASDPSALDKVLRNVANALPKMSPEVITGLLTEPRPQDEAGNATGIDLGGELLARLDDTAVAGFVAGMIARDRTASGRLAEAFQALVPDEQHRGRVLELAENVAAQGPLGKDPMFTNLWHQASEMLLSYTDEKYISDEYASDLSKARAAAVEMERISDDPPDRVAAWVASVSDEQVRRLDQQVLGDLLVVERRRDDWRKVHALALSRIDQLVLVGDLPPAQELLDTLLRLSRDKTSEFVVDVKSGLAQLASGDVMTHIVLYIRQAEETDLPRATRFCLSLGKTVVSRLIDAILVEDSARTIRRLREVLMSFGGAARDRIAELCSSGNAAVRRTAIELLRVLGGDALPHLVKLLEDDEPQVQRDALRAIMHLGSDEAYAALQNALTSGPSRTRETIMHSVATLRDERAAPLFAFIVRQGRYDGSFERLYLSAIDALGHLGGSSDITIGALVEALPRGKWWAPLRTRRLRGATARALRAIGSPDAMAALTLAAENGSRGVRSAARAALSSRVEPARADTTSESIDATPADDPPAPDAPPPERSTS